MHKRIEGKIFEKEHCPERKGFVLSLWKYFEINICMEVFRECLSVPACIKRKPNSIDHLAMKCFYNIGKLERKCFYNVLIYSISDFSQGKYMIL